MPNNRCQGPSSKAPARSRSVLGPRRSRQWEGLDMDAHIRPGTDEMTPSDAHSAILVDGCKRGMGVMIAGSSGGNGVVATQGAAARAREARSCSPRTCRGPVELMALRVDLMLRGSLGLGASLIFIIFRCVRSRGWCKWVSSSAKLPLPTADSGEQVRRGSEGLSGLGADIGVRSISRSSRSMSCTFVQYAILQHYMRHKVFIVASLQNYVISFRTSGALACQS